jgi:hypothetical protein
VGDDDKPETSKGQQLNLRVEAAAIAGTTLSAWMKTRLTAAAMAEIAAMDEKYGGRKP